METLWQDLRFAARMMRKNMGFTLVAISTLALGIGANTAMFTVINNVLLRPLPYENPERLVMLWENNQRRNLEQQPASPDNLKDWRSQSQSFESIAYWTGTGDFNLVTDGGIEKAKCAYVSSNLFPTMRATAGLGRSFLPEEDQDKGNRVALLSHEYWRQRFAGDPQAIGRTITVDTYGRRDYTIVGVLEPGFSFPNKTQIWLPVGWDGIPRSRRGGHWLTTIARLKEGASLEQAKAEMNLIQGRIAEQNPEANVGSEIAVVPLLDQTLGRRMKAALYVLWGVVGCVLLIACANVANLLLARAAERQKEIAVRLALGGSRWRMIRQLLTESMLLAFAGSALGVALAAVCLKIMKAMSADQIPRLIDTRIDSVSLGFTLLIAALTGVMFGLAPAWQTTKPDLNLALKDAGRSPADGAGQNRMRSLLIVVETALSIILLIGAGLMLRSFGRMTSVDRGFEADHLLTAKLDFSVSGFTTWVRETETRPQTTLQQLMERLRNRPNVQSVAAVSDKASFQITIENRQTGIEADYPRVQSQGVSPDYFRAMGVPLLRGRTFTESDSLLAPRVAVLSESLARRWFPNEDPIGKRYHTSRLNPGQQAGVDPWTKISNWTTIIGIAADVKSMSLDPKIETNIYVPYWQWPMQSPTVMVRSAGNPSDLSAAFFAEIRALGKTLPTPKIQTMNEKLADVTAEPRFHTMLLGLFGLLTLALVSAGVYSVVSYTVAQRTHEIGVRMALGAQANDVYRLMIGQGMKWAMLGVGLGLAGAMALTRTLRSLLFEVSATDPLTFAAAAIFLALIVFAACTVPSRRAAKVDPMIALRAE